MGKTKLLLEVRNSLNKVASEAAAGGGRAVFSLFFGVAETASKNHKLHPWQRIFRDLFDLDA